MSRVFALLDDFAIARARCPHASVRAATIASEFVNDTPAIRRRSRTPMRRRHVGRSAVWLQLLARSEEGPAGCGDDETGRGRVPAGQGCGDRQVRRRMQSAALSKGSVGCSFWTLPPDDPGERRRVVLRGDDREHVGRAREHHGRLGR